MDPKGNAESNRHIPTHFPVSDGPDEGQMVEIPLVQQVVDGHGNVKLLPSPMKGAAQMQVDELITVGCLLKLRQLILLSIVTQDDSCEGFIEVIQPGLVYAE